MSDSFLRMRSNPGAIVNTDNTGLQAYKLAKKKAQADKEEINNLKNEVSEMKQLLQQLLEKIK